MNDDIPNYPQPEAKPEPVPVKILTSVERSLAKPDAFAKPGRVGNVKVRVRLTNQRQPGRPKKRKRDPRDVRFY